VVDEAVDDRPAGPFERQRQAEFRQGGLGILCARRRLAAANGAPDPLEQALGELGGDPLGCDLDGREQHLGRDAARRNVVDELGLGVRGGLRLI